MQPYRIPIWKTAPFCRLLLPLMPGIILQWYLQFSPGFILCCLGCSFLSYTLIHFLSIEIKYRLRAFAGILLNCIIASFAMLLTWHKDIRNDEKWFGHFYNNSSVLLVTITEPPVEKTKTYKCEAVVEQVYQDNKQVHVNGRLLIYFSKNPALACPAYSDRILIRKPLQQIRNSGNPGAFNYEQYAAFQQLFHNVYLKEKEFVLLPRKNINRAQAFIYSSREYIVNVLRKYLSADKNILGIAEALLIGYKEDLDKDLVQAYSNTGVVHIIAISGLHLGLIYVILVWIFNRLPGIKRSKLLRVLFILAFLWFFALLTGASASVLRSAVMFTCIVTGKNYFKSASIYNSIAASAFLLLCFDPYFLWDVGFQLSYLAVIGIVWLQQSIYRAVHIKNKYADKLWGMISVTLAAQVITFPVCIYYFHQFPNMFLITNILAVPLSTLILFAEIFLVSFSWIPMAALWLGKLINILIWLMNLIIEFCDGFPFSRFDNIQAGILSTWILYAIVIAGCCWIFYKSKLMLKLALLNLFVFSLLQGYAKVRSHRQKKLVIYNVPHHRSMDLVSGNEYLFYGDSVLEKDCLLQNFHLKPARIAMQVSEKVNMLAGLKQHDNYWTFFNKKILLVDTTFSYESLLLKQDVDILLISNDPELEIARIAAAGRPSVIVFDSSNSLWKIANWKRECMALALPCFSIPEQGAFVSDIE